MFNCAKIYKRIYLFWSCMCRIWNVSSDGVVTVVSQRLFHCSWKEREMMIVGIRMWDNENLSMIVLGWSVYSGQVLAAIY